MQEAPMRCDTLIQIRAPETLAKALTAAADKRLISRSDYIRGAVLDRLRVDDMDVNVGRRRVIDRLRADGIDPGQPSEGEAA
jgi:hypothetical protein